MEHTIVIIWGQNSADDLSVSHFSANWTTAKGQLLSLIDVKTDNPQNIVDEVRKRVPAGQNLLIFLHETTPHNYTEHDRQAVIKLLSPYYQAVRARLFGGGKGKIYFGLQNMQGILGARGRLGGSLMPSQPPFTPIHSELIESERERRICQSHFEHVWNAYWDTPFKVILDIAEDFNWHVRGFDTEEKRPQDMVTHLKKNDQLWERLHIFAGAAQAGNAINPVHQEFDLSHLLEYLSEEQRNDLVRTRAGIKHLLNTGSFEQEPIEETASKVYNALFSLHEAIGSMDQ